MMEDEELWDRMAEIERKIAEAPNVHTERHYWNQLIQLFHDAGYDDNAEAVQNSMAYRGFEVREAWQYVIAPFILNAPRPIKWLIRKLQK